MASQVLTVNHVVELLLQFQATGNWKDAITQVLPSRKKWSLKGEETDNKKKELTLEAEKIIKVKDEDH